MTVSLTGEKIEKFNTLSNKMLVETTPSITEVAGLVGLMVSYTPAVDYAGAHFKCLEKNKIRALKRAKGNFDDHMWISTEGRDDIIWWRQNLTISRQIRRKEPDLELFTDASLEGWGAHTDTEQTGGRWHEDEITHINALELRAILFGLKSLCKYRYEIHIRIRTDSTTALAYVKNMGGTKSDDCQIQAKQIWNWAQEHDSWLSITHIPGVDNVLADLRSRKFKDHLEWSVNIGIFEDMCQTFGSPEVDLFASRLNAKLTKYVSWEPDPDNWKTDAFSFTWTEMYVYCFPPFSLLPRVVRKVLADSAEALILAPHWTAQPWLPLLEKEADDSKEYPKQQGNLIGHGSRTQCANEQSLGTTRLTVYHFWRKP